eukprot:6176297-Pleurochrysis_carterae.AAC.1
MVGLVVRKLLAAANCADEIERGVLARVEGVVLGRGTPQRPCEDHGADRCIIDGVGEQRRRARKRISRAVFGLGAASADLPLMHA